MPAKREEPNAARRSQRQRIDLRILNQEGFDRSDMEKALRASLEEIKDLPNAAGPVVLIRDVTKNEKVLKKKKPIKKAQGKINLPPVAQKRVIVEKELDEKPKKPKVGKKLKEKVIVEKNVKGKTVELKSTKTKKKIAEPSSSEVLMKPKSIVKAKNTKKNTPIKKNIVKQPVKKSKQSSDRKRMAHTQICA